jgi:hypothetical protein
MQDNNQDQQPKSEKQEKENVRMVSSPEEFYAILDGHAIKTTENGETKYFYLKPEEKIEVAHQIATMYLQQHPRSFSYATHLSSSEDESEFTFYHTLSDDEIAIIRQWQDLEYDEDNEEIELQEYLMENHYDDLLDKLLTHLTPFQLDTLDGCDLDDALQFTNFSIQFLEDDGTLRTPAIIGCPLTDDEFVELLELCLLHSNRLSMNMLVYKKPELAQRLIRHLVWSYCDYQFESYDPSICDLYELKSIARSILDPSTDILHLKDSQDIRIQAFLKENKIETETEK